MKRTFILAAVILLMLTSCGISSTTTPLQSDSTDTGFSDVKADAWYADAVKYCVEQSLMSGTSANMFSPNVPTSRAMLATILYRMEGSPKATGTSGFSDVAQDTWYTDAVTWAALNEIVSGYGFGSFGVNDPVTREQIATILWRYSGSPDAGSDASAFSDAADISAYAAGAVNWARSIGLISGKPGNLFDPKGNATRAEVATILRNYSSAEELAAASRPEPAPSNDGGEENAVTSISITVGDSAFSAKLYDNDAAKALLAQFPMAVNMSELNGNEKYYYLPENLPAAGERVGSIRAGELMLYGSDCLVLFYESFSTSYSYTRLGYIEDPSDLAAMLGSGNVQVSFAVRD